MIHEIPTPRIGIVVIGRNEGERLKRAFNSLLFAKDNDQYTVIYVDSGSTDGSVELAQSYGLFVLRLADTTPFSAARARREGTDILLARYPHLVYVQFLDGDCTLSQGWLEKAASFLDSHQNAGIVCGRLVETAPQESIFNRFNSLRWRVAPTGEIENSGGIFLIRLSCYQSVGGFNPSLITGEELELCKKIKKTGQAIIRLDEPMANHDSNLLRFSDWWGRAVWGGYGDALEYEVLNGDVGQHRRKETRSIMIWVVLMPIFSLLGILGSIWLNWLIVITALTLCCYFLLFIKISGKRLKEGDNITESALYALFNIIRKFPYGIGFYRFKLRPILSGKQPDPHNSN